MRLTMRTSSISNCPYSAGQPMCWFFSDCPDPRPSTPSFNFTVPAQKFTINPSSDQMGSCQSHSQQAELQKCQTNLLDALCHCASCIFLKHRDTIFLSMKQKYRTWPSTFAVCTDIPIWRWNITTNINNVPHARWFHFNLKRLPGNVWWNHGTNSSELSLILFDTRAKYREKKSRASI